MTPKELVRGAVAVAGLTVFERAAGLIVVVLLARALGPEMYGHYAFAISTMLLLAVPLVAGLPRLVVRQSATYHALDDLASLRGLSRWAWLTVLRVGGPLAGLVGLVAVVAPGVAAAADAGALAAAAILLLAMAAMNLACAFLRGLGRVVDAVWPSALLRPLMLAALIAIWPLLIGPLDPGAAVWLTTAATVATTVLLLHMIRRIWPARAVHDTKNVDRRAWAASVLPLAALTGVGAVLRQTDILMLGYFKGPESVSLYQVASQTAGLVALGVEAVNQVVGQGFARLHARGARDDLQALVTRAALVSTAIAGVVCVGFAVFGRDALSLLFGPGFSAGYGPLVVLAGGYLVSAAIGPIGPLMVTAGRERSILRTSAVAAACNVVLNLMLIPPFGMEGAAVATGISMAIVGITKAREARSELGIRCGAWHTLRRTAISRD